MGTLKRGKAEDVNVVFHKKTPLGEVTGEVNALIYIFSIVSMISYV